MKIKAILSIIFLVLFISACCDCLDEGIESKPFCSPREATVTEFEPSLTQVVYTDVNGNDSVVYKPVAPYSIHGYEFPSGKGSAGNLKIDNERYNSEAGRDRIPVEKMPLPNAVFKQLPVYLAVLTKLPTNDDIIGDFIVSDVDLVSNPLVPVARVRFWGELSYVDFNNTTESSSDFCDYYENSFNPANYTLTKYGEGVIDNFGNQRSFNSAINNTVSMIDASGNILVEDITNPTAKLAGGAFKNKTEIQLVDSLLGFYSNNINNIFNLPSYINMLTNVSNSKVVDVEIQIGDYFYYLARNGKKYLIQVLNIDERDVNGIKKRVSFIFTDLS